MVVWSSTYLDSAWVGLVVFMTGAMLGLVWVGLLIICMAGAVDGVKVLVQVWLVIFMTGAIHY